jgi:hypothetical protein
LIKNGTQRVFFNDTLNLRIGENSRSLSAFPWVRTSRKCTAWCGTGRACKCKRSAIETQPEYNFVWFNAVSPKEVEALRYLCIIIISAEGNNPVRKSIKEFDSDLTRKSTS